MKTEDINDKSVKYIFHKNAARSSITISDDLSIAILYNNIEKIKSSDVAYIDARNSQNITPLYWACSCNSKVEIVQLLIDKGADVNATHIFSFGVDTPLRVAIRKENLKAVELLLKHPDIQVNTGNLLQDALLTISLSDPDKKKDCIEIFRLIATRDDIDLNIKNRDGIKILDYIQDSITLLTEEDETLLLQILLDQEAKNAKVETDSLIMETITSTSSCLEQDLIGMLPKAE